MRSAALGHSFEPHVARRLAQYFDQYIDHRLTLAPRFAFPTRMSTTRILTSISLGQYLTIWGGGADPGGAGAVPVDAGEQLLEVHRPVPVGVELQKVRLQHLPF